MEERKRRLTSLVAELADPALQRTDGIVGEGRTLFELVKARGMEAIIAKRLGSPYAPGKRIGAWVKVKVPGYAPNRAERFSALHRRSPPGAEHSNGHGGRNWEDTRTHWGRYPLQPMGSRQMAKQESRLPHRLPDNWRRIILDRYHRPNFCPRAMWADLRDTPPVYEPSSQRHGAER